MIQVLYNSEQVFLTLSGYKGRHTFGEILGRSHFPGVHISLKLMKSWSLHVKGLTWLRVNNCFPDEYEYCTLELYIKEIIVSSNGRE